MKQNTRLTIRFFWTYIKKHKGLASLAMGAMTLGTLMDMGFYLIFKEFVDGLTEGAEVGVLYRLVIWSISLQFFSSLLWRVAGYSASTFEPRAMREITNHCFEVLHKHSFNFFNNQFVGSLVKRIARMARSFEDITDQFIFEFFPLFLRTVIAIVVLSFVSPSIGIALFVWSVLFLSIHYRISIYAMNRYDIPKAAADSKTVAYLADTITNNSTIKFFANLNFEKRAFDKVAQKWTDSFTAAWMFRNHIELVQGTMMVAINAIILFVAIGLWEKGTLTVGHFVLIQTYLFTVFIHLWDFGRLIRRYYESMADAEEMTEILNTPFEIEDKPRAKILKVSRGKVEFEKVSFSYMESLHDGFSVARPRRVTEEDESSVLRHFSFHVKPGERVAFIGPSGGGKTTIVKLLLRLFDVDKGRILIDGQDISKVTQDSLRVQIALVPQDPVLFHRSLMENIRYGRLDASNEEVVAAAKLAHADEFIRRFPKGYETHVGERGVKLSGGERQRVAIARALLANTRILILDEATSSLDSESEKLIKDALKVLMRGKTVFVIAHRLSTIIDMDRILVLEKGRIVEEGSHADLVGKEGGLYKKLWDLQVGGYLA